MSTRIPEMLSTTTGWDQAW